MKIIKYMLMGIVLMGMLSACQTGTTLNSSVDSNLPQVYDSQEANRIFDRQLPIPDLLEDMNPDPEIAEYYLNAGKGKHEIIEGFITEVMGYNGNILGPTIMSKTGEKVILHVENNLGERTTVHWHGLIVPGEMDGGPHQIIDDGETWSPEFIIEQPALTAWYHPHLMGTTATQVYQGLAGMWIHQDDVELGLPDTYGIDDIPIIIQDRAFTQSGSLYYNTNMMNGAVGNYIMINGQVGSYKDVPSSWIRLRLLNGSNSAQHELYFENGMTFYQIGSDGGLMEEPSEITSIKLAPGERAEIMVDLTAFQPNESVLLMVSGLECVEFISDGSTTNAYRLLENLVSIDDWSKEEVTNERTFYLEGMAHMVSINGEIFDMNHISFEVPLNQMEKWTVVNVSGQGGGMGMMMGETPHSFHVHGLQFQVISRNGSVPPANEKGWKDTIYLLPDEEVEILVKFSLEGIFMYHCHNLEHEDAGMMGQFSVGKVVSH